MNWHSALPHALAWSDQDAWHAGGCNLREASELLEKRLSPDKVAELLRVTRTYELGGGWSGANLLQLGVLAALQLHANRPRFVLAPALVAAAVYGQLLREHGAAGEATPAPPPDPILALEALLRPPNGPAAPDLASAALVCRALEAYWAPPPTGCKGATVCGACAQLAIAARNAQERAERWVLRANHREYAPGGGGFQRAAERFTSLAGPPAPPTPLALPTVAASPPAPLPLAPALAAAPPLIHELPVVLLSDILLEAARSDPHLPTRLDVFCVASRVCKQWQALVATEAPRLRATLLHERGYVIVPGAGLRPAARDRARCVGGYARLSGVARQPRQNAVVLRKFVRLDDAVQQQELDPGPLSEPRRDEVVQLRDDVHEAAARALQGVQLDGAPIRAAALLVARAGAKRQGWHTDANAHQTFSMLFPVDDRQFCVRDLDKPLELEPGDVLVFAGWLCHAGAERPRDAGDGLCLHAYAGSGITDDILENVFECVER